VAHRTVARRAEHREVVRGSVFLARVEPVADEGAARAVWAAERARDPDAGHHAFALRLGDVLRFDDDGEPGGTAGRPMLEVLIKRDLDGVVAVVTRTFGGVKLGAGGLARAYGGAVARALDAAGVREVPDVAVVEVLVPFARVDAVLRAAGGDAAVLRSEPVFGHGDARVRLTLLDDALEAWRERVGDLTRGEAEVRVVARGVPASRAPE
jgi:putative IMPACT (imprinted ancient) family translation regulator